MRLILTFFSICFWIICFNTGYVCSFDRFNIISSQEMEKLLKERQEGKVDFILVNALDKMIFRHAAIPGSINIPLGKFKQNAYKLGNDKNRPIIVY